MTIRDKYEYLKSELTVALADATVMCSLDFPFDFKLPVEEENRYFIRGTQTRLAAKKSMIMLDNTYKKVRLFPDEEIVSTFTEARDGILLDCKKDIMDAYDSEAWRFLDSREEYSEYVDTLISKIKDASVPFIEKLKKLTPEDIEKEIAAEDKLRKSQEQKVLQKDKEDDKGLF